MARFPIAYRTTMRALGGVLGLGPSKAWIDINAISIEVRMGWAFQATFPRGAVAGATGSDRQSFSLGVHGRNGRWLVNGTMKQLVRLDLDPEQRARVLGRDVSLNSLVISVERPAEVLQALEPDA